MNTKSDFRNFAVFTVDISSVEQKTSKEDKPYAIASATMPMEKGEDMPLRIVAVDDIAASIATGQLTLVGHLGYEEKGDRSMVLFFPTKVEPAPGDGKLRNHVILTLRAGQDAESRYSAAGNYWTRVRMALGQGKDVFGNYKPSLWLTVKGFTSRNGDETLPQALAKLSKGDLATITGRLTYDVSASNDKGYVNLIASKVEVAQNAQVEAVATEDSPK